MGLNNHLCLGWVSGALLPVSWISNKQPQGFFPAGSSWCSEGAAEIPENTQPFILWSFHLSVTFKKNPRRQASVKLRVLCAFLDPAKMWGEGKESGGEGREWFFFFTLMDIVCFGCCINKWQVDQCLDQSLRHLCSPILCLHCFPECFFAAV